MTTKNINHYIISNIIMAKLFSKDVLNLATTQRPTMWEIKIFQTLCDSKNMEIYVLSPTYIIPCYFASINIFYFKAPIYNIFWE